MRKLRALLLSTSTALTTTLISALLAVVTSGFCYTKLARIIFLQASFIIFSVKKEFCNYLVHRNSSDSPTLLKNCKAGAILALLAFFVPIILGGIKYSEYLFEKRQDILNTPTSSIYYKKCAKEAALAVAKVWDCSKTLGQQKAAVYAAANAVYNSAPTYEEKISLLSIAIPGIAGKEGGVTTVGASKKQASYPPAAGQDYVKISVTEDSANLGKITVQTDDDIASAVPAECSLDVVLAVPVNSTAKVDEIKTGLREFAEKFHCIRGTYFGVIPYSGKLSIPSEKYNGWTTKLFNFSSSNTLTLYDLYGTKGVLDANLSEVYDDSGSSNGYSIMCRSDPFSTVCPGPHISSGHAVYGNPYRRMNLRPCTSTEFPNPTICTATCTTYKQNPYPIMEPTADLGSVSAKCNGLFSPSDSYNASNFIFAALEWSNNLFQNWTCDPGKGEIAGSDNGILGGESKTISGRKKAIILVVNKPDNFAENEMTYLGFRNDADEKKEGLEWKEGAKLPTSDESWGSVCYGGGKFIAVSSSSNQVAYISDVEVTNADRLWVASTLPPPTSWYSVCHGRGKFVAVPYYYDMAAYADDADIANKWAVSTLPASNLWESVCYGDGKFIAVGDSPFDKPAAYSSNGIDWKQSNLPSGLDWMSVCYGGGKFIAVAYESQEAAYSSDGVNWDECTLPSSVRWYSVCGGNDKFVAVAYHCDKAAYSSDGVNWKQSNLPLLAYWSSVCYGGGVFVAVAYHCDKAAYSSDGINWRQSTLPSADNWRSVCCGDGKFVAVTDDFSDKVVVGQFATTTSTVGNKALKDFLGDGNPSGVTTLTTNACNKLKQAYGSDIRIYVVKYSKETGEYGYLDNCAISTGGKAYDVGNQNNLKAKLNEIAEDLKGWAAYAPAKLVN